MWEPNLDVRPRWPTATCCSVVALGERVSTHTQWEWACCCCCSMRVWQDRASKGEWDKMWIQTFRFDVSSQWLIVDQLWMWMKPVEFQLEHNFDSNSVALLDGCQCEHRERRARRERRGESELPAEQRRVEWRAQHTHSLSLSLRARASSPHNESGGNFYPIILSDYYHTNSFEKFFFFLPLSVFPTWQLNLENCWWNQTTVSVEVSLSVTVWSIPMSAS